MSLCRRALFQMTTTLVVPKKCTPGATAKHERLHERSFCLDGVVQIVSCPGVQHLCQSDDTQRGMLFRPAQVIIRHLFEQDKARFSSACERLHQLLGSQSFSACVRFVWIEIDELLSYQKACKRTGKTRRSASSRCCKQWSADHSPAAGGRVSRSRGSVLTSRCQCSGVVERIAWTSASQVVNEHLLLSDSMSEEDKNSYLSSKCFLTGLFLPPQSYPTKRTSGHCLPDVCPEIHPAFVETRNIQAITSLVHKQPG